MSFPNVRDEASRTTREARVLPLRHDETPNFYFMQYELATWRVKNLLLVPRLR